MNSETRELISKARIFVVGAGGIGCELLKNLVMSGFRNIEVVDLDTIDLSNLNRQFLFRRSHIGKPKSIVAAEAVSRLVYPPVKIKAYHANIKAPEFGPEFISEFDLVINALDNLEARRHVNRLCLAANVPLIESATEGYMGFVTPIIGGRTECFECQPKQAPKSFAVCTIRSNPTEPIHCITWAKMLFGCLWGVKDDSNAVSDVASSTASQAFDKVFAKDIADLASMEKLWAGRAPPAPLTFADAIKELGTPEEAASQPLMEDQRIWSVSECARVFESAYNELERVSMANNRVPITWDKDDEPSLNFVTAATNLRAHIFGIKQTSKFDVKAKAGNIIPAIATSNAVIAGLIVTEAIKVISNKIDLCREVHLSTIPERVLVVNHMEPPNPKCYVCGHHFLTVATDIHNVTLKAFVDLFVRKKLCFNDPSIMVDSDIIYESGEGLEEDEIQRYGTLSKKVLEKVGIENGATVEISDFSQKLDVTIVVVDKPATDADKTSEDDAFEVVSGDVNQHINENKEEEKSSGKVVDNTKSDAKEEEKCQFNDANGNDDDSDDDIIIL